MSHGVSSAGSEVLRALYEANRGKRKDATELCEVSVNQPTAAPLSLISLSPRRGATHDKALGNTSNMMFMPRRTKAMAQRPFL